MCAQLPCCRAALARSKGWAPRPLPGVKQLSSPSNGADATAAEIPSAIRHKAAASAQPLAWSGPSLRFSSAPVVEDQLSDGLPSDPTAEATGAEDALIRVGMETDLVSDGF